MTILPTDRKDSRREEAQLMCFCDVGNCVATWVGKHRRKFERDDLVGTLTTFGVGDDGTSRRASDIYAGKAVSKSSAPTSCTRSPYTMLSHTWRANGYGKVTLADRAEGDDDHIGPAT